MRRVRIFLSRLSALVRSRQRDREIDDEIASHLAEATEEHVRQGLSLEEARRAAQRSFGGVTQMKEICFPFSVSGQSWDAVFPPKKWSKGNGWS
jgi:hypothetical protein